MKWINVKKYNTQLILSFLCVSVVPILIVAVLSYYNSMRTIKSGMNEMIDMNLKQTQNSLEVWLDSYEDILFQLYTDEDVIKLVENINRGEDAAVARSQLRRKLHGIFFAKDYVKAVTIISKTGEIIDYDMLVSPTDETSWMNNYDMTLEELYGKLSADNQVKILPTEYATTFANEEYYLFHIGNRLINYKKPSQDIGVVVVSIDERLLRGICLTESTDSNKNNFHFLVDDDGNVISYIDTSKIHEKIADGGQGETAKLQSYLDFVKRTKEFEGVEVSLRVVRAEKLGWSIVHVSNQNQYVKELREKQQWMIIAVIASMTAVIFIITLLSKGLTRSINRVVEAIGRAGKGNLSEPIAPDRQMPEEIETIAVSFNHMLKELQDSMTREKKAFDRQRVAEIAALEAQINPHFIYNTLDTINWMAIDNEQYEISSAINALARILRYGIDNSNGIVTIREEAEWLKQYIFLQQTRLKSTFQSEVIIEPQLMEYKIHKLLLQPFIENTIIHGFEKPSGIHKLSVAMKEESETIRITIRDNGKGMEAALVKQMCEGTFEEVEGKYNIGIKNALSRIRMYYGDRSDIQIMSSPGEGTTIIILIPKEEMRR